MDKPLIAITAVLEMITNAESDRGHLYESVVEMMKLSPYMDQVEEWFAFKVQDIRDREDGYKIRWSPSEIMISSVFPHINDIKMGE